MKRFDAVLNGYFVVLGLLFITGGLVPPASAPHGRFLTEMNQLGPWVAGFLVLVAVRYLSGRGPFTGLRVARRLGTMAERAAAKAAAIYLFTALWAALLAAVAVRRHLAFDGNGDLAIFDQAFWNTIHGAFLRSSLLPGIPGETTVFADHFDPLQLLLIPFYRAVPSPLLLLVAQSIMLALGALPLYWIARERFAEHPALSAVFPVVYLLYLPLRGANRYDYHPGALAPPLFFFALYFMTKARWGRMILFLVMAALVKENMPIGGMTIGLYVAFAMRRRLLGLTLAVCFGLWFYAGFAWIVPFFNPDARYPHFLAYPTFGDAPSGLLLAPLRRPVAFCLTLFTPAVRKLDYLLYVLGPVAFLPLLSPVRLLLGLPFLVQNLLAAAPHQTSLHTHHTAELIPFIFFAAVGGASNLLRWLDVQPFIQATWTGAEFRRGLAVLLLASSFLLHGLPETSYLRLYARTTHDDRLHAALRTIPDGASLSTWTKILSHVAQRRVLYRFPALGAGGETTAEFVIIDDRLLPRTDTAAVAEALAALPAKGYQKVLQQDGIVLFRKRAAAPFSLSEEEAVESFEPLESRSPPVASGRHPHPLRAGEGRPSNPSPPWGEGRVRGDAIRVRGSLDGPGRSD
jgi:uncharacterized membrane protein